MVHDCATWSNSGSDTAWAHCGCPSQAQRTRRVTLTKVTYSCALASRCHPPRVPFRFVIHTIVPSFSHLISCYRLFRLSFSLSRNFFLKAQNFFTFFPYPPTFSFRSNHNSITTNTPFASSVSLALQSDRFSPPFALYAIPSVGKGVPEPECYSSVQIFY